MRSQTDLDSIGSGPSCDKGNPREAAGSTESTSRREGGKTDHPSLLNLLIRKVTSIKIGRGVT